MAQLINNKKGEALLMTIIIVILVVPIIVLVLDISLIMNRNTQVKNAIDKASRAASSSIDFNRENCYGDLNCSASGLFFIDEDVAREKTRLILINTLKLDADLGSSNETFVRELSIDNEVFIKNCFNQLDNSCFNGSTILGSAIPTIPPSMDAVEFIYPSHFIRATYSIRGMFLTLTFRVEQNSVSQLMSTHY